MDLKVRDILTVKPASAREKLHPNGSYTKDRPGPSFMASRGLTEENGSNNYVDLAPGSLVVVVRVIDIGKEKYLLRPLIALIEENSRLKVAILCFQDQGFTKEAVEHWFYPWIDTKTLIEIQQCDLNTNEEPGRFQKIEL